MAKIKQTIEHLTLVAKEPRPRFPLSMSLTLILRLQPLTKYTTKDHLQLNNRLTHK